MGYTTDFEGTFKVNKRLDDKTFELLFGLSKTRRMGRKGLAKKYGIEGEFYCPDDEDYGLSDKLGVIDYNTPPKTQPSLWCQWTPLREGDADYIEWDGGEKFYNYVEWITYLIESVLKPKGYSITGEVKWRGEDIDDCGVITIKDNQITTRILQ